MFYEKRKNKVRRKRIMDPIVFLPVFIAIIIVISACSKKKGTFTLLEDPNDAGFIMDFKEWSQKNSCKLLLNEGDTLQIEVDREDGEIALKVSSRKGNEPYTGKKLESGLFTVTVAETDNYDIVISGKNATGKVSIKKLESIDNSLW